MYQYNQVDKTLVSERAAQFKGQVERRLNGSLKEEEFRILRLQNGLYNQIHAYMLRIAVPYGLLNTTQVRKVAELSKRYDKGYVHVTTRQNFQYNWPELTDVPAMLEELASVEMHAIQTSGNCIRNTTTDQFAGVAADEIADPRPYCEIIRQWSMLHPEFAYLPRKFKIAVCASEEDRAAVLVHDIGLKLVKDEDGQIGFDVYVGGGLGRTPLIGQLVKQNLAAVDLLSYLEAVVRIYNQLGRRDNKYKARIKILIKAMTPEKLAARIYEEWQHIKNSDLKLNAEEIEKAKTYFEPHNYADLSDAPEALLTQIENDAQFKAWYETNVTKHKVAGYCAVTVSLKSPNQAPGDITFEQLNIVADLADKYSFGEVRNSHKQNMILADVRQDEAYTVYTALKDAGLAHANIDKLTDMITCPGLSYCDLANAHSITVAENISKHFDDLDYLYDLNDLRLNISGCMNACGHHHVGHIGILGVDKKRSRVLSSHIRRLFIKQHVYR